MHNPFFEDCSDLSESEIQTKITELTKKYHLVSRSGNKEVLTQLQSYITMYRQELLIKNSRKNSDPDSNLDDLINVD